MKNLTAFLAVATLGLLILLIPEIAHPAPVPATFAGDATEGSTSTLLGTSFGSLSGTKVIYDRFEAGVAGSSITVGGSSVADYGAWTSITSSTCGPVYVSDESYGYGSQAMMSPGGCRASSPNGGEKYVRVNFSSATQVFYSLDWKTRGDWHGYTNTTDGVNIKMGWLSHANSTTDTDYYWGYQNTNLNTAPDQFIFTGNDLGKSKFFNFNSSTSSLAPGSEDDWKHVMIRINGLSPGQIEFWDFNSTGTLRLTYSTNSAIPILEDPAMTNTHWTDIRFPGFLRLETPGSTVANMYHDNLYLSTGPPTHVAITDSPNLFSSTKFVTQEVLSWTDTAIQIRFRQGPFTAGQTVYFYVWDSNHDYNTTSVASMTVGSSTGASTIGSPPPGTANSQLSPNGLRGIFRTRTRRP